MNKARALVKFTSVSLAGAVMITSSIAPIGIGADTVANEEPLAGITLSLDKYCANVASGQITATPIEAVTVAQNTTTDASQSVQQVSPATDATDTQAPAADADAEDDQKPEHIKLNLNYDRLGIAKVDTYLNVRKKPDDGSKVIGKMVRHAGCHVYWVKKGWAKIVSGKVKGYVKSDFLVLDEKAEAMAYDVGQKVATVNTPALKVRTLPTIDSEIHSVIALDEDFEICKEKVTKEYLDYYVDKYKMKDELKDVNYDAMLADLDNWVCIRIDDEKAFVSKQYVEISFKLKKAILVGDVEADDASGVTSARASLVETAKQYLGNRYVWGGTSLTSGTDCSGYTMRIFQKFGHSLPRTSGAQAAATKTISASSARPGDLFFYGYGGHVSHVAIYIGGGMIIHASNPSDGIKISNAYYRSPIKVGRVLN